MQLFKRLPRISTARIVLAVSAVIVGYFLVTGATTFLQGSRLSEQEDRLRAEIAALQERSDRLEALQEYLSSDEYIEVVARQQLGLVRKGESAIVVISTKPSTSGQDEEETGEGHLWWRSLTR